ncbi:hypothetical protein AARAC_011766 [Aspergillus arachidicola]|uniref:Uncharacterized protein n=1 Tax=Aspergillus arachidicola TaxID=656916 RepID=A0A2G7GC14_9EURO|nr:hypothetical protein AARAC_011766 [Aspergillus arachidicola]
MTWLNRVQLIPHVPRPLRRLIRFLRGQSDELTLSDQMPSYEETSTTVVPYMNRGNVTVETHTTVWTSLHICGQDIGGTQELTTDSASDRSTLVGNTGTATKPCTLCRGLSITTAPSPSEDHFVEIQHFGELTPRDSEETIFLPNPALAEMFIGTGMSCVPHTGSVDHWPN